MKRSSRIQDPAKEADLASGAQVGDVTATKEGTSFDTPAGTRGSRQTFSGPFARWLDKLGGTRIGRKVFRKLMGCDALVLTTIGRKSGTERTTRVACFPGGGSWLIVAAAGGTASAHRKGGRDADLGPIATTFLAHGEGAAPLGTSARGAA